MLGLMLMMTLCFVHLKIFLFRVFGIGAISLFFLVSVQGGNINRRQPQVGESHTSFSIARI
jgi:hypothetical protein